MKKAHPLCSRFFLKNIFLVSILSYILTGCNNETSLNGENYSIYILGKEGKEYIIQTNSLITDSLSTQDGIEVDEDILSRSVIIKDGFYYHLNRKTGDFEKYFIKQNDLKLDAKVSLESFAIENFYWIDESTLLLIGLDNQNFAKAEYYTLSTSGELKILNNGLLPIPAPGGKFTSTSIGITELIGDKLFIAYTYHKFSSPTNYNTSDTIYTSILEYPSMDFISSEKDTRSAYPGGINTVQSYSFYDENGDLYFMSCPGIALGNNANKPTGIFRVLKNKTTLDKDYFFNLNELTQNNAYGMWYLGNGKAIVRSERKDLFKDFSDHAATPHFEFYIIDLIKQEGEKLNLPLDKGTRKECVIVEGNTAFIAVNSTSEGNYVWMYNLTDGSLQKGLKLIGDTNYILRIDRLRH